MHRIILILLVAILPTFTGCATSKRIDTQSIQHFDREAIRLSNGTIEVTVVPSLGRIVHFSFVGEKSVLWENALAVETAKLNGGWQNWGGDKVWLWPQADWQKHFGKTWPPAGDPPGATPEIRVDNLKLTFTSPPIDPVGLRIVREIELDGSSLRVVSRLEPEKLARQLNLRPWMVTQLAVPDQIHAHAISRAKPAFAPMSGQSPWPEIHHAGDSLTLVRPPNVGAKTGLEADRLIATYPNVTFTQRLLSPDGARYASCERAQIYSDPDSSPFRQRELPPYIEFEFVAPLGTASVETIWTLQRR